MEKPKYVIFDLFKINGEYVAAPTIDEAMEIFRSTLTHKDEPIRKVEQLMDGRFSHTAYVKIANDNDIVNTHGSDGAQQSVAWSDEDDAMLCGCFETEQYMLDVVDGRKSFDVGNEQIKEACQKELDWLGTLKDRYLHQKQWKPSEEQMRVLALSFGGVYKEEDIQILRGLFEQLKAL